MTYGYLDQKSFSSQIKDGERHLRAIELKYGKDSRRYKERAKALDIQRRNYKRSTGAVKCG